MMITATGPITLITGPRDRTIVLDPRVRYQPTTVDGRRYRPTPNAPRPRPAP
ncbi:hypothetical protein [Nocardia gipuzkoensis]|uniref:hypothetical protein n=1 Tax=Nocardia gipuzkoensis TaxID=2749991 RepID=UPI00237E4D3A|nr:hypothetical protein [Nocardia gipuzkoensis]MDE1675452.1 hypothetical protein [Nocardia gipuzkoensis]